MMKNSNIIVWNCRGAAGKEFFKFCKYYIDIYKPEIFVCMETRCDPKKLYQSCKKLGFNTCHSVDNIGFAGGIIVACKDDNLKVQMWNKEEHFIHLKMQDMHGREWMLTLVYASPYEVKRKSLWEHLRQFADSINLPWLVAGDFNEIAFSNEKKGGAIASGRKCKIFRDNMEKCKLLDLVASGPFFTWRGPIYHGGQRIYERLDRAISNEEWRLMYSEAHAKVLPKVDFSDHHPIMTSLMCNKSERGPKPFRFESAWMVDENYNERLRGFWRTDDNLVVNLKRIESDAT
ncbi:uncharacterized protein LOC131649058 [Vicia villosa]|uniref:uncharacterized protein LOC131649058 n=1 Tax=Vicia villosa TaxID=3911 RepID=UPI00273B8B25|nr:uncharacterized protein LOC131649058 [Vicia villosa]